jgi:hypothetical protein
MLYLIFGIVSIGLLAFLIVAWRCNGVYNHKYKVEEKLDDLYSNHLSADNVEGLVLWFIAWIGFAVFLIMSCCVVSATINQKPTFASLEAERGCLVYELENNLYNDGGDDVVGKKELYTQIRDFNKNLAYNKAKNENPWIGIFYSDSYSLIEPIPLE